MWFFIFCFLRSVNIRNIFLFQVFQLVWSRLKGFPYWPSILLDSKTDLKLKLKNQKSVTNKYEFISYWLDSGKVSYVKEKPIRSKLLCVLLKFVFNF